MKTKKLQAIITLSILLLFFGTAGFSAETTETEPIPTYEEVKKKTQELKTKIMELQTRLNEIRFKLGKEPKHYRIPRKLLEIPNSAKMRCIYYRSYSKWSIYFVEFLGEEYKYEKYKNMFSDLFNNINAKCKNLYNKWLELIKKDPHSQETMEFFGKVIIKYYNDSILPSNEYRDKVSEIFNYHIKLLPVLDEITEDLNDAETDYNRRVHYKNSNTAMFFISSNQYVVADKIGVGYLVCFPIRFAYFFKSHLSIKFGFIITAEVGTFFRYPKDLVSYSFSPYYDFSISLAMRTYKFYISAGFFAGEIFGERNSGHDKDSYTWYPNYGLNFTAGFLLTRHFFIGLNLKVFLTKYFEMRNDSFQEHYKVKPVLIGFEAGVYF